MQRHRRFTPHFPAAALAALVCLLVAGGAFDGPPGTDATGRSSSDFLSVGDPAPALNVAHWLRGEEVESFGDGRIHVVEFWATWCKYCQAAIPALAKIHESFAPSDVNLVAVSDERLQTVVDFLVKPEWNALATFSVATDPDLSTQKAFMGAAALGDIPTVFLIGRDGIIEWIGHPHGLEAPLKAVIGGTWDREKFRCTFDEKMAGPRARYPHMLRIREAYKAGDWAELDRAFEEAIKSDYRPADLKVQRFLLMIGEADRVENGYAYGRELVRDFWNDARALNNLAWFVMDGEQVKKRDYDFALKAAERAAELTEHTDAAVLDTLARVCFERGDLAGALKWQRQAVAHLRPDDPFTDGIHAALKLYETKAKGDGSE